MSTKFNFTKDHAKMVLELGKQGASQKTMYATIGISKATAARLKKEDPLFAESMDLATVHGQAFWETQLLANIENKAYNSRLAEIALRGQYPDDYRETREQKIDVKADVSIDFKGAVDDLIKKLKAAA
jgi:DNA-binding XRE family transcriptional regulator